MNPNTGEIYPLAQGQEPKPGDIAITEEEKRELEIHPPAERMAALQRYRSEARTEAKPRTKRERTSGMPRRNGDNPSRGKKKGRR